MFAHMLCTSLSVLTSLVAIIETIDLNGFVNLLPRKSRKTRKP